MRRAIKVLSVLVTVCALAWAASPALANCPFSLPMLQGGDTGLPAGGLLTSAADVNGFFWELGFGDPADGAGNDGNSVITGYPAFTHAVESLQWIKGAGVAPNVDYDWFNNGIDNCISGGAAAAVSTVLVYYMIDSNDEYAIAALQGTAVPIPHNNLDLLVTGVGANGNDVEFGPREVVPFLTNTVIVDDNCVSGDVGAAEAGMNLNYDAGGPYDGVVDTSGLALTNGGAAEACDPATGCSIACIARNAELCWGGDSLAVASATPPSCAFAPTIVCDPGDPANAACFGGAAGACLPGATTPFGPPIPGGCLAIGGPTISDDVVDFKVMKNGKNTVITWKATQFAVSSFNLLDTKRGRTINNDPIARLGGNDGGTYSYEFVATGADLRGAKDITLQMVRTDGQTVTYNVVD